MRRIPIDMAKPGMVLGKTVYSSSGNILLSAGMSLNAYYIERLCVLRVPAVFVKDGITDDIPEKEVVSDETRIATQKVVKKAFNDVQKTKMVSMAETRGAVNDIIDDLLINQGTLVNLTDIRAYDDYLFGHSVNVCVLSILTGLTLGYNQIQLRELGLGALLHDIGKVQIDSSVLLKDEPLTEEEYFKVLAHSELGFELIRKQDNSNALVAHVAFQHHERFDGKGYPRGLSGQDILEFARIAAIADIYDSLTSDRVYAKAYHPSRALLIISDLAGTHLDPEITKIFLRNIAFYPLGSIVELNTGEVGVVVDNRRDYPKQPIIRVVLNKYKKPVTDMFEVDLVKKDNISIIRVLNQNDPILPSIQVVSNRLGS